MQAAPGPAAGQSPTRSRYGWLAAALIFLIALIPRVTGLADFFTIDEPYHWIGRVQRFADALLARDWAATNQTGHPGVTTMWLGTIGRWLAARNGIVDPGWAGGGADYLAMLRLPLAVANSLAIVAGYLLLRRIVRPSVAFLGALLWATSPFLIAHSRLLHLDALLTSCMTLSILALLAAVGTADRKRISGWASQQSAVGNGPINNQQSAICNHLWLVALSGLFGGLALLTKSPSLLLLPVIAAIALFGDATQLRVSRQQLIAALKRLAVWGAVALLLAIVLWPALWVAPIATIGSVIREIIVNGGEEHHSGNFFAGQEVGDPGPLFYPVVVLWRTTPWTLLGLIALAGFSIYRVIRRDPRVRLDRALLWLAFFAIFFGVVMSIEPKKFDRYLLPIWPAIEILAAAGLVAIADWGLRSADRWLGHSIKRRSRFLVLGSLALVAVSAINLTWYQPYYLAYFNPLLGGGSVAQRVMLVGWGEGLEEVGAWLRARPDLKRGPVLSWIPPVLAPFIPAETLVLDLRPTLIREPSSYAVLYSRSIQHRESPEAEAYVRQTPALFTLRKYGIDYASIHQLPRPFTTSSDALFEPGLHLRGFSSERLANTLVITPSWDIQRDQPGGQYLFVHVLDEANQRIAQIDAPLDQGMFAQWQAGQQFDSPLPIALPATLAPGDYRVVLGVYDPASGARHALSSATALAPEIDGPHVLLLQNVSVP